MGGDEGITGFWPLWRGHRVRWPLYRYIQGVPRWAHRGPGFADAALSSESESFLDPVPWGLDVVSVVAQPDSIEAAQKTHTTRST